ncbi:MAG: plasmid partition protein ParG, partial [Nitrososphaeraceae archaeon]
MTHDLIVRGFDDEVHADLGKLANQKGVSINSIVKDAVDKWLKQREEIPKKHYLVIFSDDESMINLLRSMDRLAKENDLFRCFCAPPLG